MDSDKQASQEPEGKTPPFDAELYEQLKSARNAGDGARILDGWHRDHFGRVPNLPGAKLQDVHLEGAWLNLANFKGADLQGAHLQGADLEAANLKGAKFLNADLQGADLWRANLQGAELIGTNLRGVCASYAIVDGDTLLEVCDADDKTYFKTVGLDSARIEEELKARLKGNSRKHYWTGYSYRRKRWSSEESRVIELPETEVEPIIHSHPGWYDRHPYLQWPVWLFWCTSNYGQSTGRLILSFAIVFGIFTGLYLREHSLFFRTQRPASLLGVRGKQHPNTFDLRRTG